MDIIIQLGIIFGICLVSEAVSMLLPFSLPGSIVGMLLLLVLLLLKIIKKEQIQKASEFLLANLAGEEQRGAKYVSVIAVAFPDGRILTARGECHGEIAEEYRGHGGFGYDPIFRLPDGRHMAELDAEEKNRISHRANALNVFYKKLKEAGYADK